MSNTIEGPVLVTGGTGFLGGHLVAELERQGVSDVRPIGRQDADLTEQTSVNQMFETIRPRIVIHLAAEVGGIGANQANPGRYFYANAVMGLNVIEEARRSGVEKFVQVGTVCSYPKHTNVPFSEDEIWNGYPEETNAPYGIAKRSLLSMLQAYRTQYDFNGIYLLPANLYGPGDNFDPETSHVIPALIRRFTDAVQTNASEMRLWGSGRPTREFLHVRDAARAIARAARSYNGRDPVNLGTGVETTIRELATILSRLTGFEGRLTWDESRPDGQPRRALNVTRGRELFGFVAEVSLEAGLRETLEWWQAMQNGTIDGDPIGRS